ncbi:hypothetical protein CSUI_008569, partial [Cystoisospora suis]
MATHTVTLVLLQSFVVYTQCLHKSFLCTLSSFILRRLHPPSPLFSIILLSLPVFLLLLSVFLSVSFSLRRCCIFLILSLVHPICPLSFLFSYPIDISSPLY